MSQTSGCAAGGPTGRSRGWGLRIGIDCVSSPNPDPFLFPLYSFSLLLPFFFSPPPSCTLPSFLFSTSVSSSSSFSFLQSSTFVFLLSTLKTKAILFCAPGMTFLLHRDYNLTVYRPHPDWLRIGQNENSELWSLIKDSHPCSNSPQNRSGSGIKSWELICFCGGWRRAGGREGLSSREGLWVNSKAAVLNWALWWLPFGTPQATG